MRAVRLQHSDHFICRPLPRQKTRCIVFSSRIRERLSMYFSYRILHDNHVDSCAQLLHKSSLTRKRR